MSVQLESNPMKKPCAGLDKPVLQIGKRTETTTATKNSYFGPCCKMCQWALLLPLMVSSWGGWWVWVCPCFLHTALPTTFDHPILHSWVSIQANLLQAHLSDSLGREQDAWCKLKYVGSSTDVGGMGRTMQIALPGCSAPISICIVCSRCKVKLQFITPRLSKDKDLTGFDYFLARITFPAPVLPWSFWRLIFEYFFFREKAAGECLGSYGN